ncbi:MAG: sigma-70 family RNA polymerase sigma factor [Kouleothrix sp.]|nr:sigma-70 family RNA polymerase sigma factor [Kouleothrix sp.]
MQAQQTEQNTPDGYELFRRAIVERDERAWAEGTARYRPMLISWAARCSASATIGEHCDDIADCAFARAWAALSPDRFARFPTLASLLAYLRTCVTSAVIDTMRSETNFERITQLIEVEDVATPEQIVLERLERRELWRIVSEVAQTEQERVVVSESFVYGLPPRDILMRHPGLFDGAVEIYTTKRNLLDRLKRCAELRLLYQEWLAA